MSKILGYILALVGLAIIAFTNKVSALVPALQQKFIIISGIILVFVGVFLVVSKDKSKAQAAEIPIYEGVGKKRRIVGYRRD